MDAIQRIREAMRPIVRTLKKDPEDASEYLDNLVLAVESCGTYNVSTGSMFISADEEDE